MEKRLDELDRQYAQELAAKEREIEMRRMMMMMIIRRFVIVDENDDEEILRGFGQNVSLR